MTRHDAHTMVAAVVTASFVAAVAGACYGLRGLHPERARAIPRSVSKY